MEPYPYHSTTLFCHTCQIETIRPKMCNLPFATELERYEPSSANTPTWNPSTLTGLASSFSLVTNSNADSFPGTRIFCFGTKLCMNGRTHGHFLTNPPPHASVRWQLALLSLPVMPNAAITPCEALEWLGGGGRLISQRRVLVVRFLLRNHRCRYAIARERGVTGSHTQTARLSPFRDSVKWEGRLVFFFWYGC